MTETRSIFEPEITEPEPPRRGLSFGNVVFGILLIGIGVVWLFSTLDVFDFSWRAILSGVLIVVGLALVVGATQGAHGGLITVGVILSVILALASTAEGVLDVPLSGGIGDRTYQPVSSAALDSPYRLAIGDLTVDLRNTQLAEGTTEIEASVAIGQLTIEVPAGVVVEVQGEVGAGRLLVGSTEFSGTGVDQIVTDPGFSDATRRLRLVVRVGLGNVEVHR